MAQKSHASFSHRDDGVDESGDAAGEEHQLGVEEGLAVAALIVGEVVADDTDDDRIDEEENKPGDHTETNGKLRKRLLWHQTGYQSNIEVNYSRLPTNNEDQKADSRKFPI